MRIQEDAGWVSRPQTNPMAAKIAELRLRKKAFVVPAWR